MTIPPFNAEFAPADLPLVSQLLARNPVDPAMRTRIRERATRYVETIRGAPKGAGLEDFMQEYSLSTREGLALMVLAEALLRIPDAATQDRLIEDKLSGGQWDAPDGDESWLLMAASWGIGLSAKIIRPGETPGNVLKEIVRRLGKPVVRTGVRQAMQYLGFNFVLGQTIDHALDRAAKAERRGGTRYSYDMLGEGARTDADADRYYDAYARAIEAISSRTKSRNEALPDRPGISVKLSALSPRYQLRHREEMLSHLVPKLLKLSEAARQADLNFTMDAEEADRLELSLDIFAELAAAPSLAGWSGLGLAVQAYQKRAPAVIAYIDDLAQRLDRRFMVRLVKGAYWDSEIKRAQERGADGYPVFSRKGVTDLCYLDCARALLAARPRLYPQFATHNALTMAAIIEMGGTEGYEFQRLHGMGDTLHKFQLEDSAVPVRVYAPVGGYKDLLAYLVRRLLENAANSSFVAQIADERVTMDELLALPQEELRTLIDAGEPTTHPLIAAPSALFPGRVNSNGREFGHRPVLTATEAAIRAFTGPTQPVRSLINRRPAEGGGAPQPIRNPSNLAAALGEWVPADAAIAHAAIASAQKAFPAWNAQGAPARAKLLRQYADRLQAAEDELLGVLVREAGKTADDAIAEIREAIDFCRYYADEAEKLFVPQALPGPVGESNTYHREGRGVFIAIAPWNFPLAIFLGQVMAAAVAGNTVIAKPAPQTPLTASIAMRLLAEAGFPPGVVNLVLGGGDVGAALVGHPDIAGVVFTGSTTTARAINRRLAERDGPIIPLIAETGGINAMIVDSTALPEQVADDVVASAFRSAGQRCSALRMLYIQEEVAEPMIEMIIGAARSLIVADPARLATDVGPIIDADAVRRLEEHWGKVAGLGRVRFVGEAPASGTFFAPRIVELDRLDALTVEAFGPILHIARFRADQIDEVIAAVGGTGYGLTFGIHSRLDARKADLARRAPAGNVYINRNVIGAVVGAQPFGGRGLSGTGPKAGGPLYLTRFCEEKVITENTTAAGGNASLIALSDA